MDENSLKWCIIFNRGGLQPALSLINASIGFSRTCSFKYHTKFQQDNLEYQPTSQFKNTLLIKKHL
jgi:hypothetical protein